MNDDAISLRARACLLGLAVGDAVGKKIAEAVKKIQVLVFVRKIF